MTHPPAQPPAYTTLFIYVIAGGLVLYRLSRPMKMSMTRLFIMPVLLLILTAFAIWGGQVQRAAEAWQIAVAVLVGVIFGIPLGFAMSSHRVVRRTEKPHVMQVDSSWLTAVIWIAAFVLRAVIRLLLPAKSVVGTVVGDGLLLFAIAAVLTSYWVLYRKFRALDETPAPAT